MKPVVICFIAVGAAVSVSAAWISSVLPVTVSERTASHSGLTETTVITRNVWGQSLHESVHVVYGSQTTTPQGEVVAPDEYIDQGPVDSTGVKHGKWIRRDRERGVWREAERWYENGYTVTREEWERR